MSDPKIDAALDAFVNGFVPPSHRAAGIKPAMIDLSMTAGDIRRVGEALLLAYDPASANWPEERAQAEATIAALTEENRLLTEKVTAHEAATSTANPPVIHTSSSDQPVTTASNAPPPEAP